MNKPFGFQKEFEITAALPHIGIDVADIPKTNPMKIKDNEEAYAMLLNTLKTSTEAYEKSRGKILELEVQIRDLELKSTQRKCAIIIMTIAEIIISIGVGGLFTDYAVMSYFVIAAGVIMTILSLYLNFKK